MGYHGYEPRHVRTLLLQHSEPLAMRNRLQESIFQLLFGGVLTEEQGVEASMSSGEPAVGSEDSKHTDRLLTFVPRVPATLLHPVDTAGMLHAPFMHYSMLTHHLWNLPPTAGSFTQVCPLWLATRIHYTLPLMHTTIYISNSKQCLDCR